MFKRINTVVESIALVVVLQSYDFDKLITPNS